MPVRFMHYIANFYTHLHKTKVLKPSDPLPPIFPIVLYNGNPRWQAKTNIGDMIHSVPAILKPYQPSLSYYLIDEGAYSESELEQIETPLSAVFTLENAKDGEKIIQGISRARRIILLQKGEDRERIDKILTRWIKRHLKKLGVSLNIENIDMLVEDIDMLAENL